MRSHQYLHKSEEVLVLTPQEVDKGRYTYKWSFDSGVKRFIDVSTDELVTEYTMYGSIMSYEQAQIVYRILRDRKVELSKEIKDKFSISHPSIKVREQQKKEVKKVIKNRQPKTIFKPYSLNFDYFADIKW